LRQWLFDPQLDRKQERDLRKLVPTRCHFLSVYFERENFYEQKLFAEDCKCYASQVVERLLKHPVFEPTKKKS
jgi:hypothetical protein